MNAAGSPLLTGRGESALLDCLLCGPRRGEIPPNGPERVRVTPFPGTTAFPTFVVELGWGGGESRRLFLKTFATSRLEKPGLGNRRAREVWSYQNVLDPHVPGTASLFGVSWDEEASRYWLLLEYVDGIELRSLEFEHWVRAAGWLGRMQASVAQIPDSRLDTEYLLDHDAEFFAGVAEEAFSAVGHFSSELRHRLAKVLRGYDQIVAFVASQPRTLVHGSFRPQNILMDPHGDRVCPVDWELAGRGSPLYDLAFLCDGFDPPRLHTLWQAFLEELEAHGGSLPEGVRIGITVDCLRLHKQLKSLSDSVRLGFPHRAVSKLVGLAEALRPRCVVG